MLTDNCNKYCRKTEEESFTAITLQLLPAERYGQVKKTT